MRSCVVTSGTAGWRWHKRGSTERLPLKITAVLLVGIDLVWIALICTAAWTSRPGGRIDGLHSYFANARACDNKIRLFHQAQGWPLSNLDLLIRR